MRWKQRELILRLSVSEVDSAGVERLVLFVHLRRGVRSGRGPARAAGPLPRRFGLPASLDHEVGDRGW